MKKLFSRFTAFTMAIVSSFGLFAKAEKPPFPGGSYRIFNVAVVGSKIEGGKAKEEPPGFNKKVMEDLCSSIGTKLENFAESEILDDNKISLAEHEFPRTSMILPERNIIFCFYDVANDVYDPQVIEDCPFALCPYTLNLEEPYEAWKDRMTKLRNFVKKKNAMCDLRFLGIVQGERNEAISTYINRTGYIAYNELDNCDYAQTINADWIFNTKFREDYESLINSRIQWGSTREREFKQCKSKDFPVIIKNPGMQPAFFEYQKNPTSVPAPIAKPKPAEPKSFYRENPTLMPVPTAKPKPTVQTVTQPTAMKTPTPTQLPFAPKSEASEESKKKSEQIRSCELNNSIACGMYRDYFLPCEEIPVGYAIFEGILKVLLQNDLGRNEIMDGLKSVSFDGSCLQANIKKFEWHSPGKPYQSIQEAYNCIFNDSDIRKSFEVLFKNLLDLGFTPNQIIGAFFHFKISEWKTGWVHDYRTIKFGKLS